MEKIIKEMKSISAVMGFMGVFQVFKLLEYFQAMKVLDAAAVSAMGMMDLGEMVPMDTILPIVKGVGMVPLVVCILFHLILCIKGFKEANDPSPAKFHIVLAVLGLICYVLAAVSTGAGLFDGVGDLIPELLDTVIAAACAVLLYYYVKNARQIRTAE